MRDENLSDMVKILTDIFIHPTVYKNVKNLNRNLLAERDILLFRT